MSFYRHTIPRYPDKAKPLTELPCTEEELVWTPHRQEAFDESKRKLIMAPALAYMDFKVPFMFTTDALCQALVAVLSQVQE
jgi:hypothetical protein